MPRLRYFNVPSSGSRAEVEADLNAEARAAGLCVRYHHALRREGQPHIEIKTRRGQVLQAFRTAAAALEWLQAGRQQEASE